MAGTFKLKPIWNDKDFSIHTGVLGPQAAIAGPTLGDGIIFYSGAPKVSHRSASDMIAAPHVLSEARRSQRCFWNAGHVTEIVNEGTKPTNLFRVSLNFTPRLSGVSSKISATAAQLLSGQWPSAFQSSIETDLNAIGSLAKPFAAGSKPSNKDIVRARLAKEDLEFKLEWLAGASSKPQAELASGWGAPASDKSPIQFYSILSRIGGKSSEPPPPDPFVEVTVNTKAQDGAEVGNCRVFANLISAVDENDAVPFAELSTPTTDVLSVGRYAMWAVRGRSRGQSDTFSVGKGNKRKLTLDLVAP
jgi:hypothetical protein